MAIEAHTRPWQCEASKNASFITGILIVASMLYNSCILKTIHKNYFVSTMLEDTAVTLKVSEVFNCVYDWNSMLDNVTKLSKHRLIE